MRPPVIVTSTTDIATILRGDRENLGLSGEELDEIVGWPDRYAAKAESPKKRWGRTLLRVEPMGDFWLKALGRSLVLLDSDVAERLVREHAASLQPDGRRVARVQVMRMAIG